MKLSIYFLFVLNLLFLSLTAISEPIYVPKKPSKKKLSMELKTEFYRSNSNYTEYLKYNDLPDDNQFQYFGFHPSIHYSPFSNYMNFHIFSENFYASSKTSNINRDVFRPATVGGGISFHHKFKNLYAGIELRGGVPLYGNFQSTDEMIVGDGAYFIEPGLSFLFQPSKMFYLYYNSAFRYRFFSLSSLLYNRFGGVLETQYINAGFSANFFFSIIPDSYTQRPEERWDLTKKVNGGSYKFYSVNPSAFSVTTWLEFKYKPVSTKFYVNLDTFGKNYARGLSVGLITKLEFSTKKSFMKSKRSDRFDFGESFDSLSDNKETSHFEEEEDPYDKEDINKELKKELNSLRY